jgi:hypothetical protein
MVADGRPMEAVRPDNFMQAGQRSRDTPSRGHADPMKKKRRRYLPRIVGCGKIMMPADLTRLHKYIVEIERISVISDEVRAVVAEEWPQLAHKLPPKEPRSLS